MVYFKYSTLWDGICRTLFGTFILCIIIFVSVLNGKLCFNHNNFMFQKLTAITT